MAKSTFGKQLDRDAVGQNSVLNGKILENTPFKHVYIPSASHDAGTSIGSALYLYNHILSNDRLENINQRTRDGGAEIVKFLEKGSAFYAPAASGVQMAEAYLKNQKKILPCAAYLNGQYGFKNIYAGVPVVIGKNGVEKIEEINLDEKEKKEFMHSIDAVKNLWEAASKIDPDLSK